MKKKTGSGVLVPWDEFEGRSEVLCNFSEMAKSTLINRYVENPANQFRLTVQEKQPTVLDYQILVRFLRLSLVPEIQSSSVIDLPGNPLPREHAGICDRGARCVFPHSGGVNHDASMRQAGLLCLQEMRVDSSLPRCIRMLVLLESQAPQAEMHHTYLRGAKALRPDLD